MAEFPTYEEMVKRVAEKALDEFLYQGKSIREWMKIIAEQEPCEDAINRQAVLDCLTATGLKKYDFILNARDKIKNLPSVKPQEPILEKIRAEIEQAADKQFQIAMGIADLNERYTHIQMENAYRHCLNVIDKYRGEADCRECKAEHDCYECKKYEEREVEE